MVQFSYSFCMAMLHSIWQAALLVMLYFIIDKVLIRNIAPLAKRNFLYTAIAVQIALFVFTFLLYLIDLKGMGEIAAFVQNINTIAGENNFQLIAPWILAAYVFVITYKLLVAVYSWVQFKKQYKTGLLKPSVDLKLFTDIKAHQFGLKRKVKLWLSSSIQTPVTFGFFKPIILLPVALLNNISTKQAETLILHELTHIRTNDYLLNWLLISAETVFFFNPFITSLCKKIRLEREKNCDINVLQFEYSPVLYAETLLQAERIKQLVPVFQLAAVNRKKHLLQRITFFTSDKMVNQNIRFNIIASFMGLALLAMLSTAIVYQSGNAGFPAQSAIEIHGIPFSNHLVAENEYGRQIHTDFVKSKKQTEEQVSITETVKDIVTQPDIQAVTVSKPVQQKVENLTNLNEVEFAMPVATKENDAARQIIIKEEGSGSASVKVYYLSFENDKWILKPEWILTAKEINSDSLTLKTDSLLQQTRRIYQAQQ